MAGRVAPGTHARRVARRLEARGLPGLGEALVRLEGHELGGRWRVAGLYAVGAEGAVYDVIDLQDAGSAPCVVKIPLVPYHRPAELSSILLRHRRASLRTEASYLARSGTSWMPEIRGLHDFLNPLLDARRGGAFTEPEAALVMERLPGMDVDLWLARVHRSGIPAPMLQRQLDGLTSDLLLALHALEERGFIYADLRPGNLRVSGRPLRRLKLLDAGSLVAIGDSSGRFPHVPHYLPPDLYRQHDATGAPMVPTAAVQAMMAGRALFEVATGRVPVPGRPIDMDVLRHGGVSPYVADLIEGLASGSFSDVRHATRFLERQSARHPVIVPGPARAAPVPAAAAAPPVVSPVVSPVVRAAPADAAPAPAASPKHAAKPRTKWSRFVDVLAWIAGRPRRAPRKGTGLS